MSWDTISAGTRTTSRRAGWTERNAAMAPPPRQFARFGTLRFALCPASRGSQSALFNSAAPCLRSTQFSCFPATMKKLLLLSVVALLGAASVRAEPTRQQLVDRVQTCEAILQEFTARSAIAPSAEAWRAAKGV